MKNPFLLWIVLCFFLLLSFLFSNEFPYENKALWFSLLVLSYIFYVSSVWVSLGMGIFFLFLVLPYTSDGAALILFIFLLYVVLIVFQKRALRPSSWSKVNVVYVCLTVFFLNLHQEFWKNSLNLSAYILLLVQLLLNYFLTGLFWIFLERKGALIEDKIFPSRDSQTQLDLFSVQQMKSLGKSSSGRFQKRIRRRFGLKDYW